MNTHKYTAWIVNIHTNHAYKMGTFNALSETLEFCEAVMLGVVDSGLVMKYIYRMEWYNV